jgi:hypothetical protein
MIGLPRQYVVGNQSSAHKQTTFEVSKGQMSALAKQGLFLNLLIYIYLFISMEDQIPITYKKSC